MPLEAVKGRLDSSRNPHVVQKYEVPNRNQWRDDEHSIHESAIYSMWMHITEYVHFTQNGWSPIKASTTFNSLSENNQYSGRRRLKFLKDLSNGILLVPKAAIPRSLLEDFNVVSDSDNEEDDQDYFNLNPQHLLNCTVDSVSSGTSSTKELDEYLLQVSPTTVSDGALEVEYPRPSIRPPPGF
jgi:hypothetical protein